METIKINLTKKKMENFNFEFNEDYQEEIEIVEKKQEFHPTVKITNKVYKTIIEQPVNISEYASETLNSVHSIKSSWRMTQFIPKLTLNFFKNCDGTCMVMTKELDENIVSDLIYQHLGKRPREIKTINITLIINLNRLINIDKLFTVGTTKLSDKIHLFIDKQRYPALLIRPCETRKVVMEIFRTGLVNLTGLTKNEEIHEMLDFIKILLSY